ncbi:MAG: hypothetical protein A2854_02675 [Parcubacteria group bacterium RIFCSPHIGHO2_01_FULL_56_18]|nr:MAG: hypothetical protein A2854_02675 [Parcubacteria group bacterium RIFCSPHIGHO2_01_FULL_56_18]
MGPVFWWLNDHHEVRFFIGVVLPAITSALMTSPTGWWEIITGMTLIILAAVFALVWSRWVQSQEEG